MRRASVQEMGSATARRYATLSQVLRATKYDKLSDYGSLFCYLYRMHILEVESTH